MNIIYLHGFKSSSLSIKGQQLNDYCRCHSSHNVHLPDLNQHPKDVLTKISAYIEQWSDVVLVGSSLGGFYATQLVAKYGVPAVLINPAMRPWELFRRLFGTEHIPYQVTEQWTLDHAQLAYLEDIAVPFVQDADKIMVLLQQGDEVLDYREAERYYSTAPHTSLIMTEMHGNHAMEDFADKIPMIVEFLSYSVK
ncbi:MAG: YqiA/YcfP family alpha/beta fold hydrolase [Pseudomonadota bacterium]|uniref:Esterase n=1 Tax=Acinetobacter bereziniae TaxID=106648 RepID=A0A8I1A9J3_ACIBZ|nr:YqiA/YcfP family alpha/beta fold hydrolase [Acinetobacter bereziniae]MBJ9948767.1 esterase [Acinetobacter bereziniae]MEC8122850.1 YqiA/YcfP family alpha/beta fold hydrolase [Pseudomonadota bacterium]QQC84898.1 esterase [Acinetobacter bereziniae]UUN98049.1 esterase [Acinetobacter bereziniae]